MPQNKIATAKALVQSLVQGDTQTATKLLRPDYIQHNPLFADGREGFLAASQQLAAQALPSQVQTLRAFADGDYVVLHNLARFAEDAPVVGFDVFRFAGETIAEHWDNLEPLSGANASGHTAVDGTTCLVNDSSASSCNKRLVQSFLQHVLVQKQWSQLANYFWGQTVIQHHPQGQDGLQALQAHLQGNSAADYRKVHAVLGQGNFVLGISEGMAQGQPHAFYDLWRVQNGRLAETWGVQQAILPSERSANPNGKF